MSRLIDENTIIKMLNTMDRYTSEELTLCDTDETFPKNEVFIVDDVFEGLDELPSAQPEPLQPWEVLAAQAVLSQPEEPKTGKWIEYEQKFMTDRPFETIKKHVRECSLCRTKIAGFDGTMRYCPNCGAKMEVTT